MKKVISLLLALILLMTSLPMLAEEDAIDPTEYFDSYASRAGNIYFTMDSPPDAILHDMDLDRSTAEDVFEGICIGWKNKQQLIYSDSGREWEYHIADIGETVAEARKAFAGQDEMYIRVNTLLHFAVLTLFLSGAGLDALDPKLTKKAYNDVTLPMVVIDFE